MTAINDKFAIVPIEAFYDEVLTNAEFRMLSVLYSFRDKNCNTVWPKLESLAERAGYSDKTQVSRMTTKLEQKGWLSKGKKKGPRGPKIYELIVPDRVQLGRDSQLDYYSQVDNSGHENPVPESQVDRYSQLDIPEPEEKANLTATVNSQVDRGSQLSYEQTSINKPINQQIPVAAATAARAAPAVDNFSLPDLKAVYFNPDSETEILNHGVPLLTRSGVEFGAARNFIQMLINKHGAGRTLDALIVSLIEQPSEPKSYLLGVVAEIGNPISKDWVPPGPCLSELGALGIPDDVIEKARDPFVMWFWEMGIRHASFPALFVRWCERDWERAEGNKNLYMRRLRASAGFEEPFREAP